MTASYQHAVLDRLTAIATRGEGAKGDDVSIAAAYANTGRLVVHDENLATVATAQYDFQSRYVTIIFNPDVNGGRTHFWHIGNPASDTKLAEMFADWELLVRG